MRVCHVVNAVDQTSIPADTVRALNDLDGVEADILAWFRADEFYGCDRVTVHELSDVSGITALRTGADILQEYDVVNTHHPHSAAFAKAIAKRYGIPAVSTENATHERLTTVGLVANGLTNAVAECVVPVSMAVWESFRDWERFAVRDRYEVIYNGLDVDKVTRVAGESWGARDRFDVDNDSFLVGTAGTFKPVKDQATLIEATARMADTAENPSVELVVVGDGDLRSDLEGLAERRGVSDRVHFPGMLDRAEVYRILGELDAFAMPSESESFCVAVAEAMATRTPCVVSDIPTFRELYDDAALFHPVGDHDALANSIRTLATTPERRRAVGEAGYDRVVDRFTIESTARQYRSLYRELLGESEK